MAKHDDSFDNESPYKVYNRRYLILILYCPLMILTSFQLLEYTSITNVIAKYYNVNAVAVYWTNILQNLCTVLFSPIIGKLIEKFGFRKSMIWSTFLVAFGAAIKCCAINRNMFWLLMMGQFFPCFLCTPIYSLSSILGALWFKPTEIAAVISLCNSSSILGMAITFLLPLVFKSDSINETKFKLFSVSLLIMVSQAVIFLLTLLLVAEKPPTSPCRAEETRNKCETPKVADLLRNKNFVILIICSATSAASTQIVSISLNQSILSEFSNGRVVLSTAGVLFLVSGIPGSLLVGVISKIYPKYKILLIITCVFSATSEVLYIVSLWLKSVWLLYLSLIMFGIFANASFVLALDFIFEVSFPFPENLSVTISFAAYSLPDLILVPCVTILSENFGVVYANFVFILLGMLSLILAQFVSEDLRRRKANEMTPLFLN
ncbi:feline leukemia virus subgroup C receptor-related protein 2-like isoform X3 [Dinothrombium tinctorium]|uniref:Feline leukemia virus subgroup C receptor-related protein 2-like isoform X3 n=1 Tax=Dinothrombium tinctorium TaxID=1965070 RepID=A0A443QGR0_9ACAR|nr:feline leukemia virus subgroup C receptor-related protein 2-like isoform X3 [Dinothrombium tinctorium]